MRTSSRPVDMVFSIMGLFGVSLNVRQFKKNDRLKATIALSQEILCKGGRANWLGASLRLPPCRQLSSFPQLPQTSVDAIPRIPTEDGLRDVAEVIEHSNYNWWLNGLPTGKMDDEGYLLFAAKAIAFRPTRYRRDLISKAILASEDGLGRLLMKDVDLKVWEIVDDESRSGSWNTMCQNLDEALRNSVLHPRLPKNHEMAEQPFTSHSRVYAVSVGKTEQYTSSIPSLGLDLANKTLRAVVIEEHSPGKFHRASYFEIDDEFQSFVDAWPEREICIGGPTSPAIRDPGLGLGLAAYEPTHATPFMVEVMNIGYEPPNVTIEGSDGPTIYIGGSAQPRREERKSDYPKPTQHVS
ncbi:uncharacterized protein EV420DRAFT_1090650 [Desarmillaria tabescens]|uniref:Uncharacterized protein n=1 Tax=Armillaria tabescens TaxID=1929756 RepID=A0AA39TZ09_ARMTA|nr:uncharacterized protein EV420DRAFT_1090650 [Desarmillaria tabescens]KAK0463485.1 hypothetical protein EV420DRAFT_1090650 [Desarmillaria tabescens]